MAKRASAIASAVPQVLGNAGTPAQSDELNTQRSPSRVTSSLARSAPEAQTSGTESSSSASTLLRHDGPRPVRTSISETQISAEQTRGSPLLSATPLPASVTTEASLNPTTIATLRDNATFSATLIPAPWALNVTRPAQVSTSLPNASFIPTLSSQTNGSSRTAIATDVTSISLTTVDMTTALPTRSRTVPTRRPSATSTSSVETIERATTTRPRPSSSTVSSSTAQASTKTLRKTTGRPRKTTTTIIWQSTGGRGVSASTQTAQSRVIGGVDKKKGFGITSAAASDMDRMRGIYVLNSVAVLLLVVWHLA